MVEVLERVDQQLERDVDEARALPPVTVDERAREGPEQPGGGEAREEKRAHTDGGILQLVLRVERVHVRALEPVRQHHDDEDAQVRALEAVELALHGSRGLRVGRSGSAFEPLAQDDGEQRNARQGDEGLHRPLAVRRPLGEPGAGACERHAPVVGVLTPRDELE